MLRGKVRQITADPGELSLYLLWPRLDPITFVARAEHQDTGHHLIIKPLISLNLTRAHYSFAGEVILVELSIRCVTYFTSKMSLQFATFLHLIHL